jgi:hypothetical protein
VKAAQLEVCDGVHYNRTDLRWDLKHQYLVAHLPAVAHAARVSTTPSTIPSLGANPTASPDPNPNAPVVWTKERGKFHTKIDLCIPPTFTTEYELPTNTPDPVIPFDGAQRIMAVADVDPLNEMGGACVNFEFPDKTVIKMQMQIDHTPHLRSPRSRAGEPPHTAASIFVITNN